MNIEDIKNFLENEPLLNKLKIDIVCPKLYKPNLQVIKYLIDKNALITNLAELKYLLIYKENLKNLHIFCPICGKKNIFRNFTEGYRFHCSSRCASLDKDVQRKLEQTCFKNHGKKRFNNHLKARNTKNIRYGDANYNNKTKHHITCITDIDENGLNSYQRQNKKAVKTRINKIDKDGLNSYKRGAIKAVKTARSNIDEKGLNSYDRGVIKSCITCNIRYGESNYCKTKQYKEYMRREDVKKNRLEKVYATMKKNGTLGGPRSKSEIRCYEKAKLKYQDTEHSYFKDSRYPFNCDMYIPSQDLFIECHFSQYHHYKPFDKNCIGDLAELSRLNHIINSPYLTNDYKKEYIDIIKTWTVSDPLKFATFMNNKLNYKIFYTEKEFNEWFDSI